MSARASRPAAWAFVLCLSAAVFVVLATANSAGYRYGVSDQAFYVPSILRVLDPGLFPRDAALLDTQGRLMLSDEIFAKLSGASSLPLPTLLLVSYVATLLLLLAAAILFARSFLTSSWSVGAFCAALTLRHRIADTGANTLEGYFHPRILAFTLGLLAIAICLHACARVDVARGPRPGRWPPVTVSRSGRRAALALALVLFAVVIHPTTGMWFGVWVAVALAIAHPALRVPLAAVVLAAGVAALWMLMAGPLRSRLVVMDAVWLAAFADKDYVFPTGWGPVPWLVHLGATGLVAWTWRVRTRRGLATPCEHGVIVGCLALVALFLLSLPFIAWRIALVVQLQTSRVFWMVDVVAVAYVVWWLAEAKWEYTRYRPSGNAIATDWLVTSPSRRSRAIAVCVLLVVVSAARGAYILTVERPDRVLFQPNLPEDAWRDIGTWLQEHTPRDAHLVADAGHAWKFGSSLRVTAHRDVLLEAVKDGALAMYSRDAALRVVDRLAATRGFDDLDGVGWRALARRYDLDLLVIDRKLPLPEVHRNDRFFVYHLRP